MNTIYDIYHKLLLLEFVVEDINLTILPKGVYPTDDTCVSFQFLNNGPFEILQNEIGAQKNGSEVVRYGKSCLFALPPPLARLASTSFKIDIAVFKKNSINSRICVGITQISLTQIYNRIVKNLSDPLTSLPILVSITDNRPLTSIDGNAAGLLRAYIRLSCLGKTVVTRFQMDSENSVIFKGDENESVFRCKNISSEDNRIYIEQPIVEESKIVESFNETCQKAQEVLAVNDNLKNTHERELCVDVERSHEDSRQNRQQNKQTLTNTVTNVLCEIQSFRTDLIPQDHLDKDEGADDCLQVQDLTKETENKVELPHIQEHDSKNNRGNYSLEMVHDKLRELEANGAKLYKESNMLSSYDISNPQQRNNNTQMFRNVEYKSNDLSSHYSSGFLKNSMLELNNTNWHNTHFQSENTYSQESGIAVARRNRYVLKMAKRTLSLFGLKSVDVK